MDTASDSFTAPDDFRGDRPDRFPYGYGLRQIAAIVPDADGSGRRLLAQVATSSTGRVLAECGRFAELADAYAATEAQARAIVARRLREMRRAGEPIPTERLRHRQPWRFPDDPVNAARWRDLQRRLGIDAGAAAAAAA